jgi:hypothetical protein
MNNFKNLKKNLLTVFRMHYAIFGGNLAPIGVYSSSRRFSKLIGEKSPIRRQKVSFYEFQKKPVYPHPSNPPPDNSLLHTQSLEINTKADEFPRSPWKFRKLIRWHFSSSCSTISFFNYIFSLTIGAEVVF